MGIINCLLPFFVRCAVFTPRTVGPEGVLSSYYTCASPPPPAAHPLAIFFTQGQGHRSKVKVQNFTNIIVNAKLNYWISPFLCEVAHEYGDDLIRFLAFHRWPPPGD